MTEPDGASGISTHQPSTADLVKQATEQMSQLVRGELRLAQVELKRKGMHAGLGAGMFGAGGLVALYGLGVLIATAILALALVLPAWAAALIIGVLLMLVAGVLALIGKRQVKQASPPKPEWATDSVRADVATIRERARR